MAIRQVREIGDEVLTKKAKPVTEITPHIQELIADMLETMYEKNGVGLAAPQVGILKRIIVIDVSEDEMDPIILVNPVLLEKKGTQTGAEGCLSVPGKVGTVTRPNEVRVKGLDQTGKEIVVEGTELLARALCHEMDHLEGILYVTKVEGELLDTQATRE